MPINLREADRDQLFLLPPSVADWLPENHLAFFVLDVVSELDLEAFYAEYREDGRGGAAYDPALVLAVLVYAYCVGERSSRRIERRLVEDVAFRVVGANQLLDHATLARFRRRHAEAIAELFGQVLGLCVKEGLVDSKVISIDGTKIEANASAWANRTRRQLADEILAEAERRLVDPERAHLFDPVRVVHERCPVVARGRHHRRPGDTEPACKRGDRSRLLADRTRALTSRPRGQHAAVGEFVRALGPGQLGTIRVRASEASLGPDQSHAPVERRQVSDDHAEPILCPRDHATGRTPGHPTDRLAADEQLIAAFGHRQHPEPAQSQQRVIEFGTVTHCQGSSSSLGRRTTTRMAGLLAAPVDTYPGAVNCSRAPVH